MAAYKKGSLFRFQGLGVAFLVLAAGCTNGGDQVTSPVPEPVSVVPVTPVTPAIQSAEFKPTSEDFPNPERGFYQPAGYGDITQLTSEDLTDIYNDGHRLIYSRINLEPYRETDISAAYLDDIRTAFDVARQSGIKLIIRATYNYPRGETDYQDAQDASLTRVLSHLEQLKPVLNENVDVIAYVQAGFIGAWGEWHTSSNDLTSPENRTIIRNALFEAFPDERFIQFRYPPYMMDWHPTLPTLQSALDGTFRMGFHNDCFLASATDVGTFDEDAATRASEKDYVDTLGDLAVYGGETCRPADAPGAEPRTSCADILAEGARYNLTYLNEAYYRDIFHDNWISDGCMADIRRNIGFRFEFVRASHSAVAEPGGSIDLSLTLRNSGWARLYNQRPVEVILQNSVSGDTYRLEAQTTDPRRWLPGTEVEEVLAITLPGDLPTGHWDVLVALPDADYRLSGDPRFAIRPANADDAIIGQGWDETLGAFALGTALEIK